MIAGCTAPTQPIAAESLRIGIQQEHTVVTDLANIAKQSAVDQGVAKARAAAEQSNPDSAQSAVEEAVTQFDKVGWLLIQHERARSMLRFGQMYVWSQKGVFDIIVDDFKEAKQRSDSK